MKDEDVDFFVDALKQIVENIEEWKKDYNYDNHSNEFIHNNFEPFNVRKWFNF
jgi:glycine cleavage system protein P-like pyridoxal-binding family